MFANYPFMALCALLAALLICIEVGHRVGKRIGTEGAHGVPSDLAGALLGMLGLLLGFTVSMAESRFDARKHLVVEEANAIGTAMLRARLLPAPFDAQSRAVFVKYLDGRMRWGEAAGDDAQQNNQARLDGERQAQLWELATAASMQRPSPITATYIAALNDVIDLQAERAQMRANRIPQTVL